VQHEHFHSWKRNAKSSRRLERDRLDQGVV
jgi:hypothetical protein